MKKRNRDGNDDNDESKSNDKTLKSVTIDENVKIREERLKNVRRTRNTIKNPRVLKETPIDPQIIEINKVNDEMEKKKFMEKFMGKKSITKGIQINKEIINQGNKVKMVMTENIMEPSLKRLTDEEKQDLILENALDGLALDDKKKKKTELKKKVKLLLETPISNEKDRPKKIFDELVALGFNNIDIIKAVDEVKEDIRSDNPEKKLSKNAKKKLKKQEEKANDKKTNTYAGKLRDAHPYLSEHEAHVMVMAKFLLPTFHPGKNDVENKKIWDKHWTESYNVRAAQNAYIVLIERKTLEIPQLRLLHLDTLEEFVTKNRTKLLKIFKNDKSAAKYWSDHRKEISDIKQHIQKKPVNVKCFLPGCNVRALNAKGFVRCNECNKAFYCSKAHIMEDKENHKKKCKPFFISCFNKNCKVKEINAKGMRRCTGCNAAFYCSPECESIDSAVHSEICVANRKK